MSKGKQFPAAVRDAIRGRGRLFVVSGPSGCGKTTLCDALLKQGIGLVRSISFTTRDARGKEKDGKDYFFTNVPGFERMRSKGGFLEYAKVFGNYYGTPRRFIETNLTSGRDILLNIDVQGAAQIRRRHRGAVLIFILPPSMAALQKRLLCRLTDTKRQIRERLSIAKKELQCIGLYDYYVINDKINAAIGELRRIILASHHEIS
ncbi:MAG: guanylate kinase [Candidatus Omnitrophota bacterium]